jgi:mannosyltransferase
MGQVVNETLSNPIDAAATLPLPRWRSALREHAATIALVAITAIAAAIRFSTLGVQSFDHDESVTAVATLQPTLGGTLNAIVHMERTPPLYYVVLWIWAKPLGFGMGQLDLRSLSAIFGTITVPVAFLAGRELASRRAGLIAAAMVALNPFLVWYSQEARAYGLLVLLCALGLYLFARARRHPSRANLALWALVSALALATHYFAAFAIVPEAIWLLVATRPRARALGAVAVTGAVGLAFLPLAVLQEGAGHPNEFSSIPVLERTWQTLVHFVSSYEPATVLSPSPGVAVVQACAGAGGALLAAAAVVLLWRRGGREERRGAFTALSVGAGAMGIPVLMALGGADYFDSRNVIPAVVPLLVAAAIAFGARRAGRAGLAAAGATCALFAAVLVAVNTIPQMQRTDWRGVAQDVGSAPQRRLVVAPRPGRYALLYYLHGKWLTHAAGPVLTRRLDLVTNTPSPPHPGAAFEPLAARRIAGELWLWRYVAAKPQPILPRSVHGGGLIPRPATGIVTNPPRPLPGGPLRILHAAGPNAARPAAVTHGAARGVRHRDAGGSASVRLRARGRVAAAPG